MRALAPLLVFIAAAAVRAEDRYNLVPAVHYTNERQWQDFQQRHEAQMQSQYNAARQAALNTRPPNPRAGEYGGYSYGPPRQPYTEQTRVSGPGELHEFKDTFSEVVSDFVAAKRKSAGAFTVKNDATGEILRLKLQHVHNDALVYGENGEVTGRADFITIDEPRRSVDLDFVLSKGEEDWSVSRVILHGVNGRPREQHAAATQVPAPKAPANLSASLGPADPSTPELDGSDGLAVTVSNAGPGDAYNVALRLDVRSAPPGVRVPAELSFGSIAAGASAKRILPLPVDAQSAGGVVKALAAVTEGNGFDTEPMLVEFKASPARRPVLALSAAAVEGGTVKAGQTTRLSVTVRNEGKAPASGVTARLKLAGKDLFMSGEPNAALDTLAPGQAKEAVFEFFVNKRVAPGSALPITLSVADARGRYGFSELTLPVKMGQGAGPLRELSVAGREAAPAAVDVDAPPRARTPVDPDAYAVIIGVEKYRDVTGVDYAARDAQTMYAYLTEAMGFKPENVALLKDDRAGRSDFSTYLGPWLADRAAGRKAKVFIYYSGHGTVDTKTGDAYLVPYDGDPAYPETKAFSLKDLYASLGKLNVETVVALDSCFSGSGGRSVLVAGLRPLVPVKSARVPDNVVVLSASGGSQVSASLPDARHGLLTYYLLRGLSGAADADADKSVTTRELFEYLAPSVENQARLQHVEQRPRLEPPLERLGKRAERTWIKL